MAAIIPEMLPNVRNKTGHRLEFIKGAHFKQVSQEIFEKLFS